MTRDSILGWILFLLVGISLFLSYKIWVTIPGQISVTPTLMEEQRVDMASVIRPSKIVVHPGKTYHTLLEQSSSFYERAWSTSRKVLASLWSESGVSAAQVNHEFFSVKRGIEVNFPVPLPDSFLKQFLDIKTGLESLGNQNISSFYLVENKGLEAYLKNDKGEFYKINKPGNSVELINLLNDVAAARLPAYAGLPENTAKLNISGGIYVSLSEYKLPSYSVKQEEIFGDRTAAKFFPDFSITRKIEEKDGAVIYTDGQRGLRVYSEGALEYNAPGRKEQKPGSNFYDALNSAVEFVNSHGGWPGGTYLSSYETSHEADGRPVYKFNFRIRVYGYPLVSEREYLTVTVDGNQVRSFFKDVVTVDRSIRAVSLIPPIDALNIAVSDYKVDAVEDIYPAYILSGKELLPVWTVKTPEKQLIIRNPSE